MDIDAQRIEVAGLHPAPEALGAALADLSAEPTTVRSDDAGTVATFGQPDAPATDPLGTVRVWPRWQDRNHARELAIRWCSPDDRDEPYPWLLLGTDGPRRPWRLSWATRCYHVAHDPPKSIPPPLTRRGG